MVRQARLRESLIAIALASAVSWPAAAQYGAPPPTQVPETQASQAQPQAQAPTTAATRAEVLRAAVCVAGREAEAATALLATSPFTADERERAARLLRQAERCLRLRAPIATSAFTFRGAIAESLYETGFPQPAAAHNPVVTAAPFLRAADLAGRENAAALTMHFELAQCTVPAQPGPVRALLATEPGSAEETTALQALYTAFGSCVPAGTQIALDRGAIRATLAESLYRWSVVQRDGPTSAWAAPAAPPAAPAG